MQAGTLPAALTLLATFGMAAQAPLARAYSRTPTQAHAASSPAPAVTISPLAGTPTALPQTQISFLGVSARELSAVSVVGSKTGRHSGSLHSYASATGASFVPHTPFQPGERVTVSATLAVTHTMLSDSFTIAQPRSPSEAELPPAPGTPADVQSFQSQPELHPPTVTIDQAAGGGVAPGYVFATPAAGAGPSGPMIFDNSGKLIWFRPVAGGEDAANLQTQVFHSKNDLTWWQGRTLAQGYGLGEDVIANANYKTVAVVKAGNGLQADEHEFLLTPEGSAFITAYSPVQTSLASVGGPSSATVLDGVVQEIDVHTGLVMWEWHSLAHVGAAESYAPLPEDPADPYDYFHVDSLALGSHGDLLISARNTWALYDVSRSSGSVLWRLGGKRSTFKLGAGVPFAYQHDATFMIDGEISLFDDEGAPAVSPPSRGEFIKIDAHSKTATLAGQLVRAGGPLTTSGQGDVQELQNGGSMVGWGGLPNFTEYDSAGQIDFDGQLPEGESSDRVYREAWSAQPGEPPAISVHSSGGATAVYASWNGATTVDSWQLLTGSSASHMTAASTTPRSGFETTIPAPPAAYVQVRALSASGKALASSKAIATAGA